SCARSSKPLISSIQMSRMTTGTEWACTWERNSFGLLNPRTESPSDASKRSIDFRTERSSSTRQTISASDFSLDVIQISQSPIILGRTCRAHQGYHLRSGWIVDFSLMREHGGAA